MSDEYEVGPTGNLADEALEHSLRRTRRHLEERHQRTLVRDRERVRAGLGLDDIAADASAADPASGAGSGGGTDEAEEAQPRRVRNLERELHLAETRRKMGIDAPPVCVDNYVLERRLGGGGMGVVWKACDPRIDQTVALKILRRTAAPGQTEGLLTLAGNEGAAMAKVRHDNVAIVHTVGDLDGQPYIVMEYVSGLPLSKWVGANTPSELALLGIYAQIARGLQAVHDAGFVHADFKPDNVIIDDAGVPKVVDFGLAVRAGPGVLGGTPEYMALEQLDLESPKTTFKSDQYAFCVALFEALVGSHPYVGQSYDQFAQTIRSSQPSISPDEIRKAFVTKISSNLRERQLHRPERLRRLPRWLQRGLRRGLDPDPARRFDSMEELAALLDRPKHRARTRRTLSLIGGAALLGATAVGAVTYGVREDPCATPGAAFAELWNDSVVASLPEATREAARGLLGPYGDRWTRARKEVCEATFVREEVSGATHDARRACLDRRLDAAETALDSLKDGQTPLSKIDDLLAVTPPSSCLLLDQPMAEPPPGRRDAVVQAYDDLEREVLAAELSERYEAAQASAQRLVDEALRLGYAPLVAASLYRRGRVLLARSVNQALEEREMKELRARGEHDLSEAMKFAAGSDEALSFDAAVFHMRYLGVVDGAFSAEDDALFEARFKLDRLDEAALATVKDARAILGFRRAMKLGEGAQREALGEALSLYEEALAAYRAGGDRIAEAKVLENIGNAYYQAGDPTRALESLNEAIAIWREIDGPWSTYLGPLQALEIQALNAADHDAARRRCDEARRWIDAQPNSLARGKVDLACAEALWGDDASLALEFAGRAAAAPLPELERLSALIMAAGLRLQVDGHAPASLAKADELLDEAERVFLELAGPGVQQPLLINGYRGRLHLRRKEFSQAADRSAAAREQLKEQGPPTEHEAAQILLDLAEARRDMNLPRDPDLLDEASSYIERIADDPEDIDLLALRQRFSDF